MPDLIESVHIKGFRSLGRCRGHWSGSSGCYTAPGSKENRFGEDSCRMPTIRRMGNTTGSVRRRRRKRLMGERRSLGPASLPDKKNLTGVRCMNPGRHKSTHQVRTDSMKKRTLAAVALWMLLGIVGTGSVRAQDDHGNTRETASESE